jgi:hypothetical protein
MAGTTGAIRKAILLAAVAALLALAAWALAAAAAAPPGASSRRLLLRLHDLPLGYSGNFASIETGHLDECGYLRPAEPQPKLKAFIDQYAPRGCLAAYIRLYKVHGSMPAPPLVGTVAMDVGSVEGAEAGLAVAPEAIADLVAEGVDQEEATPLATIGDATRLLHWKDVYGLYNEDLVSGSFVVWRSDTVIGAVFVAGFELKADDRIATALARRQQGHIEHPAPYTLAERDSTEVPLDNPSLTTPVYWLGKRFVSRRGLPALRLFDTGSYTGRSLRTPRANLLYLDHPRLNHEEGVSLDLWSTSQWLQRKARGERLPDSLRCAKQIGRVKLPHGHAAIFGGVQGRYGRCADRRRRIFAARVHYGHVIVTAETMSICASCIGAGTGNYDSLRGMKAIVRGLVPRLRPAPTPPETP